MKKNRLLFLAPLLSLPFLTACTDSGEEAQPVSNSATDEIKADETNVEVTDVMIDEEESSGEGPLTINPNCVGCGKCIKTDPEHFEWNTTGHQAQVKSQENLDTSDLESAIKNCPANAIDLM